jgi:hypothetical protein
LKGRKIIAQRVHEAIPQKRRKMENTLTIYTNKNGVTFITLSNGKTLPEQSFICINQNDIIIALNIISQNYKIDKVKYIYEGERK